MKQKTVFILAGLAVLGVVATGMTLVMQPRVATTDRSGEVFFPNLLDEVQEGLNTVVVRSSAGTITLERDGNIFRYRERANYPAESQKVVDLVVAVAKLAKLESKTSDPERYARLDLQDPSEKGANTKQVTLLDTNGKEMANIIVGKRKYTLGGKEGGTYVRLPGDPQTWLAQGELNPGANPRDWIAREVADVPQAAVARVTVTQPNGERVIAARAEDGAWAIENLPKGAELASQFTAEEYSRILADIEAEDVAQAVDIAFPKDKIHSAVIETVEGSRLTAEMIETSTGAWIKIAAQPAAGLDANSSATQTMAAINARAKDRVFLVPAYKVEIFKRTLADLRAKPGQGA